MSRSDPMPPAAPEDVRLARRAARFYRRQGWSPLPSRTDAKRPLVKFQRYWDEPTPGWWWTTRDPYYHTSNLQLILGCRPNLVAIDLDGEAAEGIWARLSAGRDRPVTWESGRGRGSRHLWFQAPEGAEALTKRWLWIGDGKHAGIELLADQCLLTAPPSRHVVTGERYRFLDGRGPRSIPTPAELPDWVLGLADWVVDLAPPPPRPRATMPMRTCAAGWRFDTVRGALQGRFLEVARACGLDVVGRPDRRGWARCRVPWEDDRVPSASINADHGYFNAYGGRRRGGVTLGIFDLVAVLCPGQAPDAKAARDWLGATYGIPKGGA